MMVTLLTDYGRYEDAYRTLAVANNRGDAAGTLGLPQDAGVRLRPR